MLKTVPPNIAYPELARSSLVLYDMAAFYLPLHGYSWEEYFRCQALLVTVEALIYQIEIAIHEDRPWDWAAQSHRIRSFLGEHVAVDAPIDAFLQAIGTYFAQVAELRKQAKPDIALILATAELRPSDIRLLHCLLLQQLNLPYAPELFASLVPLEILVDLKANFSEYDQDVESNQFNTYHTLVRTLGTEAREYMTGYQLNWQDRHQQQLALATPALRERLEAFAERHEHAYPSVPIPVPHLLPDS